MTKTFAIATVCAALMSGTASGQYLTPPPGIPGPDDDRLEEYPISPQQMGAVNDALISAGVPNTGEIFYMLILRLKDETSKELIASIVKVPEEEFLLAVRSAKDGCLRPAGRFPKSETCYDSGVVRNYWCKGLNYNSANKIVQNDLYYGSTWIDTIDDDLPCGNLDWVPSATLRHCVQQKLCN